MKLHVSCLMLMSLDGRIHPSRWTESPDGTRKDWTEAYEALHDRLGADAWLVGRVTMAEMSKGSAHAPTRFDAPPRPLHLASRGAKSYAIAFDRSGALHFGKPDIGGDPVVVLLGPNVPDSHLAELVGDGISYVIAEDEAMDPRALFAVLQREFGIERLIVEGGGTVNGSLLAAGIIDELHLLLAPALDGAPGVGGIFDVPEAAGLKGRARLRFTSCEPLEHGVLHLRYAVVAAPDAS